ncbi:hypothetical protein AYI69_g11094, partial [Smittium culicis]
MFTNPLDSTPNRYGGPTGPEG